MSNDRLPSSLRRVLLADGAVSALTGLTLAAGAELGAGLLGLPELLLRGAGLGLLPFAAFVLYVGTRERPLRSALWAVIVINALWVVDSALLVLSLTPSTLGYVFVIAQAVVVALFAELQYAGLRAWREAREELSRSAA